MNHFKTPNASKSGGTRLKRAAFSLISGALFSISKIFNRTKTLNLSKSLRQFLIKFLSSRLNARLYNKLSKETGDFKDLGDGHIYTQY